LSAAVQLPFSRVPYGGIVLRFLFLLLLISACRRSSEPVVETGPLKVRCVAVSVEKLARTVSLRGVVEVAPGHHAVVAAQTAGRLTSLAVHEGQRVELGAVLAEVDARQAADAAAQAQAALSVAEAGVQNAKVSAERIGRLFEHGIAARQEVDDAEAKLLALRATVEGAKAALEVAKRNVSFATVRAPLAGVVLRTMRATGDLVDGTPATPIVELGDPTKLNLLASAAPRELVQLVLAQHGVVHFEALPGRAWDVEVKSISPMLDATTGVGLVRLSFDPTATAPPIGLSGEAKVEVGITSDAVVIPSTAIRGSAAGGWEVVCCEDKHLHVTAIEAGARTGGRVEVTAGLDGGQRIVASEVLGLEDGAAMEELP
jgi:RND family efflux transporter MFP subunit